MGYSAKKKQNTPERSTEVEPTGAASSKQSATAARSAGSSSALGSQFNYFRSRGSPTKLYDRTSDDITLYEVERIAI